MTQEAYDSPVLREHAALMMFRTYKEQDYEKNENGSYIIKEPDSFISE